MFQVKGSIFIPALWGVHMSTFSEAVLQYVKPEDRVVLENVACVIKAMSKEYQVGDFEVRNVEDGYILLARFTSAPLLSLSDLQLVKDCNPVRVQNVAVTLIEGRLVLHVKLLDSRSPVTITETDIIRVKKRRFFGFV